MGDVDLPTVHPKKAFIVGALEKEIRLSFAARIRGTLPEPYRPLISEAKEEDTPPFKYNFDRKSLLTSPLYGLVNAIPPDTPYADSACQVLQLLKTKAPDTEIQVPLSSIQETASSLGVTEPLISSTDAFVTAICYLGSKSLSHVLSQIERCKERLLAIGAQSEPARRQIISSVLEYWAEKPGVGVNVVDKLLNYTILTPQSVVQWALGDQSDKGQNLTHAHIYEMISTTVTKVTGRVRQVVIARNAPRLPADQRALLDSTLANEREEMGRLFNLIEDALVGVAEGANDAMAEGVDQDTEAEITLRVWGQRWLRVMRRKRGVEEGWVSEMLQAVEGQMEVLEDEVTVLNGKGVENGVGKGAKDDEIGGEIS